MITSVGITFFKTLGGDHVMPCKVPCTTLKQVARLLVSTGPSEEGSGSRNICQGREFV
jgi:hypothetical protein